MLPNKAESKKDSSRLGKAESKKEIEDAGLGARVDLVRALHPAVAGADLLDARQVASHRPGQLPDQRRLHHRPHHPLLRPGRHLPRRHRRPDPARQLGRGKATSDDPWSTNNQMIISVDRSRCTHGFASSVVPLITGSV